MLKAISNERDETGNTTTWAKWVSSATRKIAFYRYICILMYDHSTSIRTSFGFFVNFYLFSMVLLLVNFEKNVLILNMKAFWRSIKKEWTQKLLKMTNHFFDVAFVSTVLIVPIVYSIIFPLMDNISNFHKI